MTHRFSVEFVGIPSTWAPEGQVELFWQSRVRPPEHQPISNAAMEFELPIKDGRWSGSSVGRNSDGRRFLYFAWRNQAGRMFRRIKLYQDQVRSEVVRVSGVLKDGSPACSTARILE